MRQYDLSSRLSPYKLKPAHLPYVLPGNFPLNDQEVEVLKREIAALRVPIALLVGDTASSFFPGDDENNNVQAGAMPARCGRSPSATKPYCGGPVSSG